MNLDLSQLIPTAGTYPCAGKCGATVDLPGVCSACDARLRDEERASRYQAARSSIPERFAWATLEAIAGELGSQRVGLSAVKRASVGNLRQRVVTLSGPAGSGKTSVACAILRGVIDAGGSEARRARFVAARNIGTSTDLVALMRASVLVIDDVGYEAGVSQGYRQGDRAQATADLLAERHDRGARTIVTTYATREQWGDLYGGGIVRRYMADGDGVRVVHLAMAVASKEEAS